MYVQMGVGGGGGGGGGVKLKAYTYCGEGWLESVTFERMYFMDDRKQKNGNIVHF